VGGVTDFYYLDLPGSEGHVGVVALEMQGDRWVNPRNATRAEWLAAGRLSASRLSRCRRGSGTWWRHRAIIAEAERRCNARLMAVPQ
jgi:hypothetical protein